MIVKNFVVVLILNVALICDVIGTSYSNVHVKSQVVPMEYYQYGTPYASLANPRLSNINSLPSFPGYVAPCETSCVYPAQTVATVTSINSVPTYKVVPSVPVVVTPTKEEATGYEYSYVVYDENTGDHKAQRELSDGSVVHGEYSFLQPDGYIREVQYVADDISGFNAVVKNFLPVTPEGKRNDEAKGKDQSPPPCNETKNESLKEGSAEESVILQKKKFEEDLVEESKEHLKPNNLTEVLGEHFEEKSTEKQDMKSKYTKEESGDEFEEQSKEKQNKSKKISNEKSDKVSEESSKVEILHEESTEPGSKNDKKSKKESKVPCEESGEGSESQKPKEELKEKSLKKNSIESEEESREKYKSKSKKDSKETVDELSENKLEEKVSYDKNKEAHELVKPKQETLVPYNDVLRCIQEAMRRNNGIPVAMRVEPSPLTYIVLNKPC